MPPLPPLPRNSPEPPVFPTIGTSNPLSQPIYQTNSDNSYVLDLPFRPFLPEGIYLSVAIPTRNRAELEHFLGHCQQLLGPRPHRNIEHPITELEQLTPLPLTFSGYLWKYRTSITADGITEDYRQITQSANRQHAALVHAFTVFYRWQGDRYIITLA